MLIYNEWNVKFVLNDLKEKNNIIQIFEKILFYNVYKK